MRQQVMTAPKQIEFRDVPMPTVTDDQVLLKMMNIGICGSDIHVYQGAHPFTSYPVTQGHEVSAEVVAFGNNVTGLRVGQKVTVQPQVVCGTCYLCTHGKYNLCENLKVMGFQTTGMASEFFAVDREKVTPLPDTMTFEEGSLIEPTAVAVHAIKQAGDIQGKGVIVLGAGPIGNLVAQAALALGAKTVLITDISDLRLQIASESGIPHTLNTKNEDLAAKIAEIFGSDKADVIYDCAGTDITINQAIHQARKGSMIILVAVFEKPATVDLAVLNDHELDLNTSMMYRNEDYLDAIRLVEAGKINLQKLISKVFPFEDFAKAYEYIDANREATMKVIIDVQA